MGCKYEMPMPVPEPDERMKELIRLQEALDNKRISLIEFEERRTEIDSSGNEVYR